MDGQCLLLYLIKNKYQNETCAKTIHVSNTPNTSPRANVYPVGKISLKFIWQDSESEQDMKH